MRDHCRGMFYQVKGALRPFPLVGRLWARQDLNLQPTDYESAALTRLSYGPARGIQINPADEPSPDPSPKSAKAFSTRRHAPHLS